MAEPSLEERLERVERLLERMSTEVASIRSALHAKGSHPAGAPRAAEPVRRVEAPVRVRAPERPAADDRSKDPPGVRSGIRLPSSEGDLAGDVERLLGRYGMLIIAGLAAAAAVGTFLSWAIARGYLSFTPVMRVGVGMALAAGIAVFGFRLRQRERSFGSSLVGLALVIAHICAHAAGPSLHLVPPLVAFALAAALSWALALFALHEEDEPLWCLGAVGASAAPFVTSNGEGSAIALLAYGAIVTFPAALAISHRPWRIAWRLFYAIAALYVLTGAGLALHADLTAQILAYAFPFALAAVIVIPFAPANRKRGAMRWLLFLAVIVTSMIRGDLVTLSDALVGALVAGGLLSLAFVDAIAEHETSSEVEAFAAHPELLDWCDAAAIPFVLLFVPFVDLSSKPDQAAVAAIGALALATFAFRRPVGSLRDASAAAATFAALGVPIAFDIPEPAAAAALVGVGLAAFAVHLRKPSRGWIGAGSVIVAIAAITTLYGLAERKPYTFTPFTTMDSVEAAISAVGFVLLAAFAAPIVAAARESIGARAGEASPATPSASFDVFYRILRASPWFWLFLWCLVELAMAYSPSTSTLLLVGYFAATGVACVGAGRACESAVLRQTGLGLALVAAGTAIYGATTYFDIGARIVAYLVTSCFLMGIAYWYRKR